MEKQPTLCQKCKKFFGTQETQFHCSSCFKQLGIVPQLKQVIEQAHPQIIVDKSRCGKCNRKVGLLGFDCKCGHTFCKLHRLSQQHQCKFDFGAEDRKRLKELNPLIKAQKLEKI